MGSVGSVGSVGRWGGGEVGRAIAMQKFSCVSPVVGFVTKNSVK
ncbi:hypothetical protein [Fortiea contorta]|nr:hypothetical protein [Fortiea contorta]